MPVPEPVGVFLRILRSGRSPWKEAGAVSIGGVLTTVQVTFVVLAGLYLWNLVKAQQGSKTAVQRESKKEYERWQELRAIRLSEPLAERTRPTTFADIVGQADGLRALRAALCGPNPQHVLIYGPPGVGKTAAARLVLEEAKRSPGSPFRADAKFVELDATIARFDERGIADPLIGSVHDPIYQGAGPLGVAGIPQPKPGAVTRAHGGVLFLDEIGELHPVQMNKLLKVLEDRKVFLESAYYQKDDPQVPAHIKDLFDNGLPADFRLVGATTRQAHEIPPAIRSRCVEIFFRPLKPDEVAQIARGAGQKLGLPVDEAAIDVLKRYATCGRDAVNIMQVAAGLALTENRTRITSADVQWVVQSAQLTPRPQGKIHTEPEVGVVNGLAVTGPNMGMLLPVEVVARRARPGQGKLTVTGVVEEEELPGGMGGLGKLRRKSMARSSVETVLTLVRGQLESIDPADFDLHVHFPGGVPVDGPSAGVTMAVAIASALRGRPVDNRLAMTGELGIRGHVRPVGGVPAKVEAARLAGCTRVLIPKENWQENFAGPGIEVRPIETLQEALDLALLPETTAGAAEVAALLPPPTADVLYPTVVEWGHG
jgi:Lon-like ATP-dependent protease